ncbi:hypothetical protein N7495_005778 [Penicillium taxi]|uniref:uncharacterized protein n=1 Tax=Penicillium taxi TaxID=168475 RepID=UPI00254535A1|nr:uncharacterized protein N7495_005778 [Penicillium taxi]KAJ5894087.1 hypothetical protein N7495_005778 [Penicillium taxi]
MLTSEVNIQTPTVLGISLVSFPATRRTASGGAPVYATRRAGTIHGQELFNTLGMEDSIVTVTAMLGLVAEPLNDASLKRRVTRIVDDYPGITSGIISDRAVA